MSRLSRANVKARESIFAGGPEQYIGDTLARCPPDLEECVLAMEDCCEEVLLLLIVSFKSDIVSRHMKHKFYFVLVLRIYQECPRY
jgi:hypothetical protein